MDIHPLKSRIRLRSQPKLTPKGQDDFRDGRDETDDGLQGPGRNHLPEGGQEVQAQPGDSLACLLCFVLYT